MDIVMYNCFYIKFINLKVAKSKTNNTKKMVRNDFGLGEILGSGSPKLSSI
jgi:hypothetical protein